MLPIVNSPQSTQHCKLAHVIESKTQQFPTLPTPSGGSYRNWNRRYFVLRRSTLSYYVSEGDKSPKGVIDLTKGRGVRPRDHCQLDEGDWPRAARRQLAFGLAVDNRTFHMYGYDQAAVE